MINWLPDAPQPVPPVPSVVEAMVAPGVMGTTCTPVKKLALKLLVMDIDWQQLPESLAALALMLSHGLQFGIVMHNESMQQVSPNTMFVWKQNDAGVGSLVGLASIKGVAGNHPEFPPEGIFKNW